MRAAYFTQYAKPITIENLADPDPVPSGVVIKLKATGVCRSDWHGWQGHDSDVQLPHVPGHELAGTIAAVGKQVSNWQVGDRVTLPFCMGCGHCSQCREGQQQVCDHYFQPGFTAWGSFAEYVAVPYAEVNLVRIPGAISFETAAVLGCRFITAFRAIVHQAKVQGGQWVAVHGCGGVGLSAIMIAQALSAQVIAIDIEDEKLELAKDLGAAYTLNASQPDNIPEVIKTISKGGTHISIDALGSKETCWNSVLSLRKRGKHIQVGLLHGTDANPPLPMGPVIANELEILGSHGMQAHQYPGMLEMILAGRLRPQKMIGELVSLEKGVEVLQNMDRFPGTGVTIINQF